MNVSDETIILFLKQTRRIQQKGFSLNGRAKVKLAITPGTMGVSWLQLRQRWLLRRPVMAPNQACQLSMHRQMAQAAPPPLMRHR